MNNRLSVENYHRVIDACTKVEKWQGEWFSCFDLRKHIVHGSNSHILINLNVNQLDEMVRTGVLERHTGTPLEKGTYAFLYRLVSSVVPDQVYFEELADYAQQAYASPKIKSALQAIANGRGSTVALMSAIDDYKADAILMLMRHGMSQLDAQALHDRYTRSL